MLDLCLHSLKQVRESLSESFKKEKPLHFFISKLVSNAGEEKLLEKELWESVKGEPLDEKEESLLDKKYEKIIKGRFSQTILVFISPQAKPMIESSQSLGTFTNFKTNGLLPKNLTFEDFHPNRNSWVAKIFLEQPEVATQLFDEETAQIYRQRFEQWSFKKKELLEILNKELGLEEK